MVRRTLICAALVLGLVPSGAQAAFPGENGKIVFSRGAGTLTVNPNGSGETALPSGVAGPRGPASWSPDGTKLVADVFLGCDPEFPEVCNRRVAIYNADGTNERLVGSNTGPGPGWSNDGRQIVYPDGRRGCELPLRAVNADGTNDRALPRSGTTDEASFTEWSPDGTRILFLANDHCGSSPLLHVWVHCLDARDPCGYGVDGQGPSSWGPDGKRFAFPRNTSDFKTDVFVRVLPYLPPVRLTTNPAHDLAPAWSPDGTKIAFVSTRDDPSAATCNFNCLSAVYVMNADGTGQTRVSSIATGTSAPDWQPLPVDTPSAYVRPKAATPVRVSLVPAYRQCTSPTKQHGPPLAQGSCEPDKISTRLTVGPNAGLSAPNKSVGYVKMNAVKGAPGPADEADMLIRLGITNVMWAFDFSDYGGELVGHLEVRRTDTDSGSIGSTSQDFPFEFTALCNTNSDPGIGASCAASTSADAVIPGLIKESARTILELGQVQIFDGGNDADAETAPNFLFATQGVFVP